MKTIQFLAVAGLMLALATAHAEDKPVLKEGDKAPDFKLKASDGKEYSLKQFAGKQAVVIAWFPKAFTGGCTKECKSMRENGEKIRKYEVAYFTASCDTPEENTRFAESLSLDYPILSDPTTDVAKAYGVFNPERKVSLRWTFYIDKDGVVKAIDKTVKTETHGEDVAKKLEELGVAKKK
ncbi:MAG: redoxin domain-containing protein [Planctomycetia bacterium]|nr:redoxin domain-containing protein [Planctomycetia bacterium]